MLKTLSDHIENKSQIIYAPSLNSHPHKSNEEETAQTLQLRTCVH